MEDEFIKHYGTQEELLLKYKLNEENIIKKLLDLTMENYLSNFENKISKKFEMYGYIISKNNNNLLLKEIEKSFSLF